MFIQKSLMVDIVADSLGDRQPLDPNSSDNLIT